MVIAISSKRTLEQNLASEIMRSEYVPQQCSIDELIENACLCYESDLEDNDTNYFCVQNDPLSDILAYVNFSGGFCMFDFTID